MLQTPETNTQLAALKLMRFKTLCEMEGKSRREFVLRVQDVNEILTVAGLPVIVPEELQAKEVDVISFGEEGADV